MSKVPYLQLNDGNKIPQIGLGTWKSPPGEVKNAVYSAIKSGYRHIDCAYIYSNEHEVGNGIKQAIDEGLVKREDLFVTTKCWLTFLARDRVKLCFEKSLKDLKLDYVNLYLMHWPMAFKQTDETTFPVKNGLVEFDEDIDYIDTWKAFEELKRSDLAKSIGVSNFNSKQLKRLFDSCEIKPAVNQIECHPYLNENDLIKFCQTNKIQVTAYSPLGSTPVANVGHSTNIGPCSPRLLEDPIISELAKKHNKSNAQILIRFHIEKKVVVIPKSTNEERIKSNLDVFDFKLDEDDLVRLEKLNRPFRFCSFDLKGIINHKEYPFLKDS